MKCLIMILSLMIPQIAAARLGETVEQCDKRYGDVVADQKIKGLDSKAYVNGAYFMMASFIDGKCCMLVIQTPDEKSLTINIAWDIVNNNIREAKYLGTKAAGSAWVTESDTAMAMLEDGKRGPRGEPVTRLTLFTYAYVKANEGKGGLSMQKKIDALGF